LRTPAPTLAKVAWAGERVLIERTRAVERLDVRSQHAVFGWAVRGLRPQCSATVPTLLSGWGGGTAARVELLRPLDGDALRAAAAAGGRVYLTKDSRLRPEALRAMYPRVEVWCAVRDRADPEHLWHSDLAVRTRLVDGHS
jgi:hypothetical protein